MAEAVGRVEIEIAGNTAQFEQALARARQLASGLSVGQTGGGGRSLIPGLPKPSDLKSLEDSGRKVKEVFRDIASSIAAFQGPLGPLAGRINFLGTLFGRVGIAVGAFSAGMAAAGLAAQKSVAAWADEEEQLLTLQAVLKSTGYAAGQTAGQLADLADSVSKSTLATDDQVRSAETLLATFRSVSGTEFPRAIKSAQDLAAAGFGSVTSSAMQLGKALEDPLVGLNSLRRAGVTFTAAQKELIRSFIESGQVAKAHAEILKTVEQQVGGAGAAQASGLSGAFHRFTETLNDSQVALGKWITRVLGLPGALDVATNMLKNFNETGHAFSVEQNRAAIEFQHNMGVITDAQYAEMLEHLRKQMTEFNKSLSDGTRDFERWGAAMGRAVAQAQAAQDKIDGVKIALEDEIKTVGLSALEQEVDRKAREAGVKGKEKEEAILRKLIIARGLAAQPEIRRTSEIDRQADLAIAQKELELIGKSVEEQNALRDAFTQTAHLRAEAAKTGIPADEKQIALINAQTAAMARLNQQIAETQKSIDINFERQSLFLSDTELKVASTMKEWFPTTWQAHMDDTIARQIRFNENLSKTYDLTRSFAGTFVDGMMEGKSAIDSVTDALNNLEKKLIDMALDAVIKGLFSMLSGGGASGGGIFGSLMGLGGGGGGTTRTPTFATGGFVGSTAAKTHRGGALAYDEYPAILHVGERVIPAGGGEPRLGISGAQMVRMFGGTPKFEGGWGNFGSTASAMAGGYTAGDTGYGGSGGSWGFTGGDTGFGQGGSGEYRYTPGSGSSGGSTTIGTSSGGRRPSGGGGGDGGGFVPGRRPGEIVRLALPPPSMGSFGGTGLGRWRTDDDALWAPGHEVIHTIRPKVHLSPIDTTGEPPGTVPAYHLGGFVGSTPVAMRSVPASIFIGAPYFDNGWSSLQTSYPTNNSPSTSPGTSLGSGQSHGSTVSGTSTSLGNVSSVSGGGTSLGWGGGGSGGSISLPSSSGTSLGWGTSGGSVSLSAFSGSSAGASLGSGTPGFSSRGFSNFLVGGAGADTLGSVPTPLNRPGTPSFGFGTIGPQVGAWQQTLRDLGYPVTVDNNFGPETRRYTIQHERDTAAMTGVPIHLPMGVAGWQDVTTAQRRQQGLITGGGSFGVPGHQRGRFDYGGGGFGVPGGPPPGALPGGAPGAGAPLRYAGGGAILTPGLANLLAVTNDFSLLGTQMRTGFGAGTDVLSGYHPSTNVRGSGVPDFMGTAATTVREPGSTRTSPAFLPGYSVPFFGRTVSPNMGGGTFVGGHGFSQPPFPHTPTPPPLLQGSLVPFDTAALVPPDTAARVPTDATVRGVPGVVAGRPPYSPSAGLAGINAPNWSLAMRRAGLWQPPPSPFSGAPGGFPPGMNVTGNIPSHGVYQNIPPYPQFGVREPGGLPPRSPQEVGLVFGAGIDPSTTGIRGAWSWSKISEYLGIGGDEAAPVPAAPAGRAPWRGAPWEPVIGPSMTNPGVMRGRGSLGATTRGLSLPGQVPPVNRGATRFGSPQFEEDISRLLAGVQDAAFGGSRANVRAGLSGIDLNEYDVYQDENGVIRQRASSAAYFNQGGGGRLSGSVRGMGAPISPLSSLMAGSKASPSIGLENRRGTEFLNTAVPPMGFAYYNPAIGGYGIRPDSRRQTGSSIEGLGALPKRFEPGGGYIKGGYDDPNKYPWTSPTYRRLFEEQNRSFNIFHTGGVVGSTPVPHRMLPAKLFTNAPRFAGGLAADEYPAVLHAGETVTPAVGQQRRGGQPIIINTPPQRPPVVMVNVTNNVNAQVSTNSQQTDNGIRLDIMIDEMVSGKMRDGGSKISRTLAGMGARSQPIRR